MIHEHVFRPSIVILGLLSMATLGCNATIGDAQSDAAPDQPDAAPPDECQGQPLEDWYLDFDGDGYGDPQDVVQACAPVAGRVQNGDDCNDAYDTARPGGLEVCGDGLDNDCLGGDPCTQSLLAHWRFDDAQGPTATDDTGHDHHASLTNGPTWNVDGRSLNFDGVDDYVVVPHAPGFLLDSGTIALWFRTRNAERDQDLWSKDSSGFDTGGHLSLYIDYNPDLLANRLVVRLQDTAASHVLTSGSIAAGTWYHVAVTFGANGMTLRIDGELVATGAHTGGLGDTSGGVGNFEPLVMGAGTRNSDDQSPTPISNPLDGALHDVQVYNRALDASEIQDIYQLSIP